jgi:hypothetical protein
MPIYNKHLQLKPPENVSGWGEFKTIPDAI